VMERLNGASCRGSAITILISRSKILEAIIEM
jgi:hypothetical protein